MKSLSDCGAGCFGFVGEGIVLFSHHGEKCTLSLSLIIAPLNFVVPAVEYLAEAFDFGLHLLDLCSGGLDIGVVTA